MYLTNNLGKVYRFYSIFSLLLIIIYPLIRFNITEGDFASFLFIYIVFIVLPLYFGGKRLRRWIASKPVIDEHATVQLSNLDKKGLKNLIDSFVEHNKLWRVRKQIDKEDNYLIELETPITIYSFGESIHISASFSRGSVDQVTIQSTPKIPTTEVDDGKNKANVEAVRSFIEAIPQPAEKR